MSKRYKKKYLLKARKNKRRRKRRKGEVMALSEKRIPEKEHSRFVLVCAALMNQIPCAQC